MLPIKRHIKDTVTLALPIVIGQLGHIMMGVIDNAMVGQVSPVHLAAAAVANGLFFIIMVVGIGISYAISPLVSMQRGSGNIRGCSEILRNGFYVNMAAGVLLVLLSYTASGFIPYFRQDPRVAAYAISYSKIIALSALPMMLFQTYRQFAEGLGVMRPSMIIAILANIVNAGLDYILIYGHLGFPRLELDGAGWATFFSRALMAAAMMLFVMKHRRFRGFDFTLLPLHINRRVSLEILRLGTASGMQYFFEVACFVCAAIMVGWIGAYELAAHQIAINIASITYMAVVGISSAAAIRTGNFLGSGSRIDLMRAGYIALALGAGFMASSGTVLILLRNFLPTLYVENRIVQQIGSNLLVVAAMFQIFDGIQAVGLGVLRGIADARIPTIITFIAYWVIAIPAAYVLGFVLHYGVIGVWLGLLIGLAFSAIFLLLRFSAKVANPVKLQQE